MDKLDFWVHLGDYIYEYDNKTYPADNVRKDNPGSLCFEFERRGNSFPCIDI